MIRYARYAVPYLLQVRRGNPAKKIAGLAFAYMLMGFSILCLGIAGFIWVSGQYGVDVAFAATGLFSMCAASILFFRLRRKAEIKVEDLQAATNDPLAKFVPDTIRDNPTTQKLLNQIQDNPITSTATAVTIGILLSREFLEDT